MASKKGNYHQLYEHNGTKFPIIWRRRGAKDGETDHCPFCGQKHLHGKGDGHRVSHCSTGKAETIIIDGDAYSPENGYWIVEYD